jgi:hypothetical protein
MNGVRQGWLVTRREMRERSRSRAFQASVLLMGLAGRTQRHASPAGPRGLAVEQCV